MVQNSSRGLYYPFIVFTAYHIDYRHFGLVCVFFYLLGFQLLPAGGLICHSIVGIPMYCLEMRPLTIDKGTRRKRA